MNTFDTFLETGILADVKRGSKGAYIQERFGTAEILRTAWKGKQLTTPEKIEVWGYGNWHLSLSTKFNIQTVFVIAIDFKSEPFSLPFEPMGYMPSSGAPLAEVETYLKNNGLPYRVDTHLSSEKETVLISKAGVKLHFARNDAGEYQLTAAKYAGQLSQAYRDKYTTPPNS